MPREGCANIDAHVHDTAFTMAVDLVFKVLARHELPAWAKCVAVPRDEAIGSNHLVASPA